MWRVLVWMLRLGDFGVPLLPSIPKMSGDFARMYELLMTAKSILYATKLSSQILVYCLWYIYHIQLH